MNRELEAAEIEQAAKRRQIAREHGSANARVDYDKLNQIVRKQRAVLTRAIKSGERAQVLIACRDAVREWNLPGMMWPDDWPRWQRALDDVYEVFGAPSLEDLS